MPSDVDVVLARTYTVLCRVRERLAVEATAHPADSGTCAVYRRRDRDRF
jgi:hypothetical protein